MTAVSRDPQLDRLKAQADRHAAEAGAVHAVLNLNRVGPRMLVVREYHPRMEDEGPGFVVYRTGEGRA